MERFITPVGWGRIQLGARRGPLPRRGKWRTTQEDRKCLGPLRPEGDKRDRRKPHRINPVGVQSSTVASYQAACVERTRAEVPASDYLPAFGVFVKGALEAPLTGDLRSACTTCDA